jgi:hypothetical protein
VDIITEASALRQKRRQSRVPSRALRSTRAGAYSAGIRCLVRLAPRASRIFVGRDDERNACSGIGEQRRRLGGREPILAGGGLT